MRSHACVILLVLGLVPAARAEEPAPAPPPFRYSVPWQLRPVAAPKVIRVDDTLAFHHDAAGRGGTTNVTLLNALWAVRPGLAPLLRLGVIRHDPGSGPSGTALSNLALGASYVLPLADGLKLAAFLGVALPTGTGGGDTPDPGTGAAVRAGVAARAAMDNAMFAVNDLTLFPGVGVAYTAHGLTAQVEVTFLELLRVRGAKAQPDEAKSNLTAGLHVGAFLDDWVSFGGELRLQRWLSTPAAVTAAPASRETVTFALGPRFHFAAGPVTLRPGISYGRALDDPLDAAGYQMLQFDVITMF